MEAGTSIDRLVLGVCGSIAASMVPAALIWLKGEGLFQEVRVILTEMASTLVSAESLSVISGKRVETGWPSEPWASTTPLHMDVALWGQLILVMPATANHLAKAAHGIADDLLSTTLLASEAPVIFVPAMNERMWAKQATRDNVDVLRSRGYTVIEPGPGLSVAESSTGPGGMADVTVVARTIREAVA